MTELVGIGIYVLLILWALVLRGSREELREEARDEDAYCDSEGWE